MGKTSQLNAANGKHDTAVQELRAATANLRAAKAHLERLNAGSKRFDQALKKGPLNLAVLEQREMHIKQLSEARAALPAAERRHDAAVAAHAAAEREFMKFARR